MENKGMINCPNCNKRTFADKKECIYCKYILEDKHDFDKEIYTFLNSKYDETKNKLETIKAGIETYGLTMNEAKKIVDHIYEKVYQNEEAEKDKRIIESQDMPREELPTNGIDYSKYVEYSVYTGHKKNIILKGFGVLLCFIIVILMCIKEIGALEIRILEIAICVILFIRLVSRLEVPLNPHTYVFSFFQFFIRCIVPMSIAIMFVIFVLIQIIKYVTNFETIVNFLVIITFAICAKFLLMFARQGEFTADYGSIKYIRAIYSDEKRSKEEWYVIQNITKVEETLNSIIIYGDIRKSYYETHKLLSNLSSEEKINKLKVFKTFKNNKNLVKSLKILAER